MDNKQARYLHRMLDRLAEGKTLNPQDVEALRKNLPELPKQKTLEEIAWDIHFAWSETFGNDWKEELFGDLETWLSEQHEQLRAHLEGVKSQAHPPHPEFLETEGDYENAPVGTVVIREGGYPWTRIFDSWVAYSRNDYSHSEMAALRGKSRVLRWGYGND